uniref:Uncharacterized protein n=1 Tax=Leersia perrieri TaxID=77586 RepID=A0A0D9UZ00_9ORYZ
MASPPPPPPPPFPGIQDVYRNLHPNFTIECKVLENGQRAIDFDGSYMKLHRCLYKIGPVEAQRLLKKGTPEKLAHSYLFLSTFSHSAALTVENYMVHVQRVTDEVKRDKIWENVRGIVEKCFSICGISPHESAMKFCSLIGHDCLSTIRGYPDTWDDYSKAACLTGVCLEINLKSAVNSSGIKWPEQSKGVVEPILASIIAYAMSTNKATYDTTILWDYVRLCKNTCKHFDELPQNVKDVLKDCYGIFQKMEEWEPDVWFMLYDASNMLL